MSTRIKLNQLWFIGALFMSSFTFCQYPFYFSYNQDNYLPSNEIYSIFQDQKGYIWIGCDNGMYRFNGKNFAKFTHQRLKALSTTGICESKDGKVFGYNFNGQLFYVKDQEMHLIHRWNNPINNMEMVNGTELWITTSNGLYVLNTEQLNFQEKRFSKASKYQYYQTFTGNIRQIGQKQYFTAGNYLFEYENKKLSKIKLIHHDPFQALHVSKSMTKPLIYTSNQNQLFELQGNQLIRFKNQKLQDLLKDKKVTNIIETKRNEFWICTYSGLIYHHRTKKITQLFYPKISFSNVILDQDGVYWWSSLQDGIMRVPSLNNLIWNTQTGALTNEFLTHITKNDQEIIFGGSNGELYTLDITGKKLNKFTLPIIGDLGFLKYDLLDRCTYLNQNANLYQFKNHRIDVINPKIKPAKTFFHDREAYYLAGSQGIDCYKFVKQQQPFASLDGLWCRAMLQLEEHLFLFATNQGVMLIEQKNGKIKHRKSLIQDRQFIAIVRHEHAIFLLDFEGNIYTYNPSTNSVLPTFQMGKNERFFNVLAYKDYLFLPSSKGLHSIHIKTGEKRVLRREHGLIADYIKDLVLVNDELWIVTSHGLQNLPISHFERKPEKNQLYLHELKINQRKLKSKTVYANHSDSIRIKWDALAYASMGKHIAQLKINRGNWEDLQEHQNEIELKHLKSGWNQVYIRYKTLDQRTSSQTISLSIYIQPYYYETIWFYVLMIFLIFILFFIIFKWRIGLIKKRQQKEIAQLQLENSLREAQQNALKAQMNPHFLFNVLNSIKGYIYENDRKNAVKYLNDFSQLVREVLDYSSLSYIRLDQELDFLKVYINLESMLIDGEFEYTINMDQNVFPHEIQIPSLILQPIIENAFKHGLRNKEGAKKLTMNLTMDTEQNYLLINIEDNGIGRLAAGMFRTHKTTSFATNAIQKRIQLLNKQGHHLIQLWTDDLVDEFGHPKGTRVQLKIYV